MAEWPVEITKKFSHEEGETVAPGTTISATRTREKDGSIHSYIIVCPKCGVLGDCPVATPENPANTTDWRGQQARVWSATVEDGGLTMNPSILCSCGGHFFLTDGMLKEV
jgi:hypothetical protein